MRERSPRRVAPCLIGRASREKESGEEARHVAVGSLSPYACYVPCSVANYDESVNGSDYDKLIKLSKSSKLHLPCRSLGNTWRIAGATRPSEGSAVGTTTAYVRATSPWGGSGGEGWDSDVLQE